MRTLPDQDLRIRNAVAVAKMTAADLWQDYQKDAKAADKQYWGKAVEVSGKKHLRRRAGCAQTRRVLRPGR